MKLDAKTYKISIDGEMYTFASDEGEEHLRAIEKIVDGIIKDLREKNPHMASSRLALCAAIRCASHMARAQELALSYQNQEALLASYIDKALAEHL